jgi:hypothetical protein
MKAEDFTAWLSAISGMNEGQRAEAIAALEMARAVGAEGRGSTSVEPVAAQGCPHCAGREVVGWGRSHGLLRFRCKSCGRTFNALTKLKRDRRSGRDLRPRILQGPMVRSPARATQTRRQGQASGALSGQYSRSRRPRPEGRDLRRGPASG